MEFGESTWPVFRADAMDGVVSRAITVQGATLNVTLVGEGPAVLLVHGFPDDHQVWKHQIPALAAAGYQVIAPDTRGCGASSVPAGRNAYRLSSLVSDLKDLLDALGIEQVELVGHDWGGVICWHFVMAHPERVRRYVALSIGHPRAYATDGMKQKLKGWYAVMFQWRGVAEALLKCGNWWFFRVLTGYQSDQAKWIDQLSRPGRLTASLNYYRANLVWLLMRRRYPEVVVPVLGIWSSADRFLSEGQMLRSENMVSAGWQFQRIDGAGHWLQVDAPERINALLLAFFEGGAA
ncbi:alpha/beta fold hydrolase [Burkholderia sp. Ac-20353]|uniref:alpha/beta fold hydrolase n=1 Tax=Burkholderia sp. Ac-20353 TaxID=2703894 RepID=UPI001F121605|nr:alpha/beta fold hydrolase [Burkholderia sp. Ac-20353]